MRKSLYRNNMKVAVLTQDLAISYPTSVTQVNYNTFIVKYYSWENRT